MSPTAFATSQRVTSMKWLLRREFWEHKGSMLWAPVAVAALLVLLLGGAMGFRAALHGLPAHVWLGDHEVPHEVLTNGVGDATKALIATMVTNNYVTFTSPVLVVMTIVSFFYCLGALYDERRDRSILFWKSLPVSDPMTVLSKAMMACLVAPAITIGVITVSALLLLIMACATLASLGVNVFPEVLASPQLYLSPLYLLALLPVYAVWALPTVGWLMLVSSWARSKPFLWAVAGPLVALLILKWMSIILVGFDGMDQDLMHAARGIIARLLGGLVPGFWFTFDGQQVPSGIQVNLHGISLGDTLTQSWQSLASMDAWVGAAAGVAMLAGAARLRRWRDDN